MSSSNAPQSVTKNIWYYEEGRTFCFVVQSNHLEKSFGPDGTIQFDVPVSMLQRSIARAPKPRKLTMSKRSKSGKGPARLKVGRGTRRK
jgi:hypothetical protein